MSLLHRTQIGLLSGILAAGVGLASAAPDGSLGDTNIKYFGRWDFSSPSQYVSYWGGSYIKVKFSGTNIGVKFGRASNYYYKIDNGPWVTLTNANGTINLTPTPLAAGVHSLSVAQGKDYDYVFNFQGLVLDAGATTSLPVVSDTMIEFIGDSITTGYTDPQANVSGYAWVCAEKLNAEHTQIAYPGVNLVSDYSGAGMDTHYFKSQSLNYPASPNWEFTNYTPKIVVVNLGQNDIGANGVPLNVYQNTYTTFLANIRTKYPDAEIFAMRVLLGFGAAQVQAAVNARIAAGDTKVQYIDTTGWVTSGTSDYTPGDGVHPSATGHIKIANRLKFILTPYVGGDLVGKVTVGYQGWFSAAGDGSPVNNWGHSNLEMWPDVREYATTYAGTPFGQAGITQPNFYGNLGSGQPAKMFSSYDQQVVNTHFRWMAEHNIDSVALQRFANEISPGSSIKAQRDGMALKVMNAALATGRKFFIEYDASGRASMKSDILQDWTNTITGTLRLTSSPAYARQNGKPIVGIYGMGYATGPIPGPGSTNDCLDVINFLKAQGCYIMGGVPGQWRSGNGDSRNDFTEVYRALDAIGPWAVGRATDGGYLPYLTADFANCVSNGMDYLPNAYPGTSFHNSNAGSPTNQFPRNAGNFLWTQLASMRSIGAPSVFIAMFDELNEATQIFKSAEDTSMNPTNNWFLTLDADGTLCSSDFYLRLVKDGGEMIKGLRPYTPSKPTTPALPIQAPVAPVGLVTIAGNGQVIVNWSAVSGAASYNVRRSNVSGNGYSVIATNVGNVGYTDTGLVNGTTNYYVVNAVNALGESADSKEVAAIPLSGVASASSQNLPNEGATKAFDGSAATKWFNGGGGNTGWLQYSFGGASKVVIGYTLASANDAADRNPKNWQFQGSQDGSSWTTLDTRTGETFPGFFASKSYAFTNTTAYGFYRLNITANNGNATGIQLAELAFVYAALTPEDLAAASFSSSQIVLNWTPAAGAAAYNIKRADSPGEPYTTVATNIVAPFFWDGGLKPNQAYYYRVTAINTAMESADSIEVSAVTLPQPPPSVTSLVATETNAQVMLIWSASGGATNYNVKRSLVDGGPYVLIGSTSSPNFADASVVNDTTYYYAVSAVSPDGESTNSTPVSATPSAGIALNRAGWIATASSGGSPRNNAIDGNINTRWSTDALQANGQWFQVDMLAVRSFRKIVLDTTPSANDYPRGYVVNVSNDGVNWGSPVATGVGSSGVTTILLNTTKNARYLRITQTGSAPGNYWSIHELYVYGAAPAPPIGLNGTSGDGQASLNWPASAGASAYVVKRSLVDGGPYMAIAGNVITTNHVSSGLENGTLHHFVVSATNAFGEGLPSIQASVRPMATSEPQLAFEPAGDQMQLAWSSSHTGWRLEAQTNSYGTGLGTNWISVPNSENTNHVSIPLNPAIGSAFFRLSYE
jgi:lysophospholipase L1-like esterase/fibronectin type 3 domain-containing protein